MITVVYAQPEHLAPTGTVVEYWERSETTTRGAYLPDETVAHEDQKPRTLPLSHCATHHRPATPARRGLNSSLSPEHVAALAERALAQDSSVPGGARRPPVAQRPTTPEQGPRAKRYRRQDSLAVYPSPERGEHFPLDTGPEI